MSHTEQALFVGGILGATNALVALQELPAEAQHERQLTLIAIHEVLSGDSQMTDVLVSVRIRKETETRA